MATYVNLAPEGPARIEINAVSSGKFASLKVDTITMYVPGYDAESVSWMRALAQELLDKANVMEGNPTSDQAWLTAPDVPAEPPQVAAADEVVL